MAEKVKLRICRRTLAIMRSWKMGNGEFLWQAQGDEPATIGGYEYEIVEGDREVALLELPIVELRIESERRMRDVDRGDGTVGAVPVGERVNMIRFETPDPAIATGAVIDWLRAFQENRLVMRVVEAPKETE